VIIVIRQVNKRNILLFIIGSCICAFFLVSHGSISAKLLQESSDKVEAMEVLSPKTVNVVLIRKYLDGEISEEIRSETILSMEDFWAFYEDWNLIDQNESRILFQQEIDDISPLLKINGYFGLSEDGILHIYEGKPQEEKIIQSFFQINTEKLKSQQQSKLQQGIPVQSRENYQEVLSLLKKYQIRQL